MQNGLGSVLEVPKCFLQWHIPPIVKNVCMNPQMIVCDLEFFQHSRCFQDNVCNVLGASLIGMGRNAF